MTPRFSFEFFPPKSVKAAFRLASSVDTLKGFNPAFMSVTCGTGGGSNALTQQTIQAVAQQTACPVAPHITSGAATVMDLKSQVKSYAKDGITTALALRGDAGATKSTPVTDLVRTLATNGIAPIVAAYPETHPKAASPLSDLDALKAKQDAGATAAITQFFFEADMFLRFRDRCVAHGITLDLIPGILPVTDWAATQRMAEMCGTTIAPDLAEGFARADRENRAALMATAQACEMCDTLHKAGVESFHIYTLNKASIPAAICAAMGSTYDIPLRKVA